MMTTFNNFQPLKSFSILTVIILFVASSVTSIAAYGAGGGGGGGGFGGLSSSAPRIDPVEKYQQGVAHLEKKQYKKATKAFKAVLSVAKKDANSHYLMGVAYLGLESFKKARRPLEKAVKYDKDLYEARGRLGYVYNNMGKPEKAEKHKQYLLKALQECGACSDLDRIKQAIAIIESSSAQTPQEVSQEISQQPEHASVFDLNLRSSKQGDSNYLQAVAMINRGEYSAAIKSLKQAGQSFGPHSDILTYLGFANRKMNNMQEAFQYYQAALQVEPEHRGANEYLGEYYVEMGNLAAAELQLQKLNTICHFGCEEAEELKRWIVAARENKTGA